jgi:hypothetical protein
MPVRKPANRSGSHIIGKFPSLKLGRSVFFESTIESDFLYVLDFDPGTTFFEEQPLTMEYPDGSKTRHYTPDFYAVLRGENWLYECKPKSQMDLPDNQRIFAACDEYCSTCGWKYRVVTDHELRTGQRLRNIKLLRQYALYDVSPQIKGAIYGWQTSASSPMTIAGMKSMYSFPPNDIHTAILHMAYHKELSLPLNDEPISDKTTVFLPNQLSERSLL